MDRFSFSPGFDIYPRYTPMGFVYGENAFGPVPQIETVIGTGMTETSASSLFAPRGISMG